MAEFVGVNVTRNQSGLWQFGALAHDHQAVHFPFGPAALEDGTHVIEIDRHFGHEDVIGGDGHAAQAGDPTGVSAHGLDDHDSAMRLGRGPQAINRFHDNIDGRVESEGEIGGH